MSGLATATMANFSRCAWPPDIRSTRRRAIARSPASSRASSVRSGAGYIRLVSSTSSAAVTPGISPQSCSMAAIRPPATATRGLLPAMVTLPLSAGSRPISSDTTVLFPAPFGPSSATMRPRGTSRLIRSTAVSDPYRLVTRSKVMVVVLME